MLVMFFGRKKEMKKNHNRPFEGCPTAPEASSFLTGLQNGRISLLSPPPSVSQHVLKLSNGKGDDEIKEVLSIVFSLKEKQHAYFSWSRLRPHVPL